MHPSIPILSSSVYTPSSVYIEFSDLEDFFHVCTCNKFLSSMEAVQRIAVHMKSVAALLAMSVDVFMDMNMMTMATAKVSCIGDIL